MSKQHRRVCKIAVSIIYPCPSISNWKTNVWFGPPNTTMLSISNPPDDSYSDNSLYPGKFELKILDM